MQRQACGLVSEVSFNSRYFPVMKTHYSQTCSETPMWKNLSNRYLTLLQAILQCSNETRPSLLTQAISDSQPRRGFRPAPVNVQEHNAFSLGMGNPPRPGACRCMSKGLRGGVSLVLLASWPTLLRRKQWQPSVTSKDLNREHFSSRWTITSAAMLDLDSLFCSNIAPTLSKPR